VCGNGTLLHKDKGFMAERDGVKISGVAKIREYRNIGSTNNMWKEREKRNEL
jgi:hypothetical protein